MYMYEPPGSGPEAAKPPDVRRNIAVRKLSRAGRPAEGGPRLSKYFRFSNAASGPENIYFCDLSGPMLPQNTPEKGGGLRPPPLPVGFAVGGGRLDRNN